MLREILLPQLGQTMEEGTIARWHKAEGDRVQKGEVLYELTTDKATLEVESFVDGVVKKILVAEDQTVPVNELIAVIGDEDDELPDDLSALREKVAASGTPKEADAGAPAPAAPAGAPSPPAEVPASRQAPSRLSSSPRARKIAGERQVPLSALSGSGPDGRIIERDVLAYLDRLSQVRYTPAARAAALAAGVSLLTVEGSGAGGRITKADVEAAARSAAPAVPKARAGERVPLSPMRQTIATRMTESKQTVPHFYLVGDVMMRKALQKRQEINASGKVRITITDLLVRAAALALRRHARANARFAGDAIVLGTEVNVGVAVAVEDGLFVPVIRSADTKDLAQVSAELKSLAEAARQGKLIPEQYEGGSITISNLGTFGVDYFLPIINPPETCILGIGKLAEQVVVQDGAMRIEPVMKVSLSADHRVMDGATAAEFYQTFRACLEEPDEL